MSDAHAHCSALAREGDRDRWIAALFAPERARKHLHALSAFALEIARVKQSARQPLAGEMRLMWWLEAIDGQRADEARAHPVANALLATIGECDLPKARFESWLLAWRDDLYNETSDVAARGRELFAPLYALSARALRGEADAAAASAGAAEAWLAAGRFDEAMSAAEEAAQALVRGSEVAPAFAGLGALKLDARRGLGGRGPAPLWRRQIAVWLWRPRARSHSPFTPNGRKPTQPTS